MSTKISALPASTGLVLTDIFPVVDDPGGVPVTQKATFTQLQTLFSAGLVASFNTRVGAVTLTLADVSTVADAIYVLKAGDTMTGSLTLANGRLTATTVLTGGHILGVLDALNAAAPVGLNLTHSVTGGTPSPGMGILLDQSSDTTTTLGQRMTRWSTTWLDATHATRTAQTTFLSVLNGVDATQLILGNNVVQLGFTGTSALPGLIHRNDVDTGLFFPSANNMGISAGGSQLANFSSTTGIILSTSLSLPYVAKTGTYTASAVDYTIDGTANSFTINLPTAVGITGRIYVIKNSGVGTITIDPSGAQTIDGAATQTVVAGASFTIQSTGAGWVII